MKLKNVKKISHSSKRYDIQTNSSNFYANNVLVHNSTLIVSKYKGQLITRTRGTIDAYAHENGKEIDILKQKYPNAFDNELLDNGHSIIFEWVSPTNRIVVAYDEVDAILIGIIKHEDYSYFTQHELDVYAVALGVKRPEMYYFRNIDTLCEAVNAFKGKEGICVYYDNDQRIVKIKSAWYLLIHKMKSKLNNINELIEMFIAMDYPEKDKFVEELTQNSDYELVTMLQPEIDKMYVSYGNYKTFIRALDESLENIKALPTRKEQALKIKELFKPEYISLAFSLLDGKSIDKRKVCALIAQNMV